MLRFDSAANAVACAVAMQQVTSGAVRRAHRHPVEIRVGVSRRLSGSSAVSKTSELGRYVNFGRAAYPDWLLAPLYADATHVTLNLSTIAAVDGAANVTITNPDGQSSTGTRILTVTSSGCQGTTTTTLPPVVLCGDANGDGRVSASDALLALRTAVGSSTCTLEACHYTGDGQITASDALAILDVAVGLVHVPKCPTS